MLPLVAVEIHDFIVFSPRIRYTCLYSILEYVIKYRPDQVNARYKGRHSRRGRAYDGSSGGGRRRGCTGPGEAARLRFLRRRLRGDGPATIEPTPTSRSRRSTRRSATRRACSRPSSTSPVRRRRADTDVAARDRRRDQGRPRPRAEAGPVRAHLEAVMPRTAEIQLLVRATATLDPRDRCGVVTDEGGAAHRDDRLRGAPLRGGRVRSGVTVELARDVLWSYNSVELYELLVLERGWISPATATSSPTRSPPRSSPLLAATPVGELSQRRSVSRGGRARRGGDPIGNGVSPTRCFPDSACSSSSAASAAGGNRSGAGPAWARGRGARTHLPLHQPEAHDVGRPVEHVQRVEDRVRGRMAPPASEIGSPATSSATFGIGPRADCRSMP